MNGQREPFLVIAALTATVKFYLNGKSSMCEYLYLSSFLGWTKLMKDAVIANLAFVCLAVVAATAHY